MPTRFLAGVLLGAALIGAPTMVWVLAMQVTGTAAVMMGDQVERWTAQEIRRARPKGWRLLNHFALREGDMDHVLLGPAGAFVFETKWSGCDWTSAYGLAKQQTAVHQASVNARSLRPWDPLRRRGVPARPVVVLWGLGLADWDSSDRVRIIDGVAVVVGPELREWLASVITTAANDLESSALDAVYAAMEALGPHRSVRCLQNEGAPHQMDRSGLGVANRAGTGLTRDHSGPARSDLAPCRFSTSRSQSKPPTCWTTAGIEIRPSAASSGLGASPQGPAVGLSCLLRAICLRRNTRDADVGGPQPGRVGSLIILLIL